MADNFKRYREFINICGGLPGTNEKRTLDKYYVIELIGRGKDNPDIKKNHLTLLFENFD